jgi:hypothetical protein
MKVKNQYSEYINKINCLKPSELEDTSLFWKLNSKLWPELAHFARYILTIPATSAPIKRVFSIGGAILSPSRRRINDNLFQSLIFLKCNIKYFNKTLNSYFNSLEIYYIYNIRNLT